MTDKQNQMGMELSNHSPLMQFLIILGIAGGFFALALWVGNLEKQAELRFEAICQNPNNITDLNCYDLQEAINVCPEASQLFNDMNCSMANRTMRMVR